MKCAVADRVVQEDLGESFEQVTNDDDLEGLTQEEVRRHSLLTTGQVAEERQLHGQQDPSHPQMIASLGIVSLFISAAPDVTTPEDRVPTSKRTLGMDSCVNIQERFLYFQSVIQDMLYTMKTATLDHGALASVARSSSPACSSSRSDLLICVVSCLAHSHRCPNLGLRHCPHGDPQNLWLCFCRQKSPCRAGSVGKPAGSPRNTSTNYENHIDSGSLPGIYIEA